MLWVGKGGGNFWKSTKKLLIIKKRPRGGEGRKNPSKFFFDFFSLLAKISLKMAVKGTSGGFKFWHGALRNLCTLGRVQCQISGKGRSIKNLNALLRAVTSSEILQNEFRLLLYIIKAWFHNRKNLWLTKI